MTDTEGSVEGAKESLPRRLIYFRKRKGLSVTEVARRLGVAESTYREWEYGRLIKGEPYAHLAELFGVTLQELLVGQRGTREGLLKEIDEIQARLEKLRSML